MKLTLYKFAGTLTLLVFAHSVAWAGCNPNELETGAVSVVDLQGQGNFSCAQIPISCPEGTTGTCTMQPTSGFSAVPTISPSGELSIAWSATEQVDKLFVTTNGNGSRCLYDFEPGETSGPIDGAGVYVLDPSGSNTTIVACSDGVEVAEPPPPPMPPLSENNRCLEALPTLQSGLTEQTNIITFIGIGVDNTIGDGEGDYVLAVCAAEGQDQCVDECLLPTDKTYAYTNSAETSLNDRACATSDELPTGNPDAPKYCWELSHDVDLTTGSFRPPTEKQSGYATWEQYEGSTCVKVCTTYRGFPYCYYSPSGCRQ